MSKRQPGGETGTPTALHQARAVVGLYGDPDTTWGICAEFAFGAPIDVEHMDERMGLLCARGPHLGEPPGLEAVGATEWEREREQVAADGYGPGDPVLRLRLRDDRRVLLVGAHHGSVDGLGLVSVAAAAAGVPFESRARGIGDRRSAHGFVRRSISRLGEAAFRPPARFAGSGEAGSRAEELRVTALPNPRIGTAALAVASLRVFADWPRTTRGTPLLLVGASRRVGGSLEADRQTAYLRLHAVLGWDLSRVRAELADVHPEPDFPETRVGGIGPRVAHLLRRRLGATALISNLGELSAPGLERVSMFPALSGPRAVAIGLASTAATTTLTLRTRRKEFSSDETAELLTRIVHQFAAGAAAQ